MTFFHFINCIGLACVPYFIVYRYSGLSEYGNIWKVGQAAAAYLVTQLVKMLILATFFPTTDPTPGNIDFVGELLKCSADIADLVGLHLVMSQVLGKGQMRYLIAGVGWSGAELVATAFIPLWIGARGIEFDWKYIHLSFESNVNLVSHVAVSLLLWMYARHDLQHSLTPAVSLLLLLSCYKPFITNLICTSFRLGAWTSLSLRVGFTALVAMATLQIFLTLTKQGSEKNSIYH